MDDSNMWEIYTVHTIHTHTHIPPRTGAHTRAYINTHTHTHTYTQSQTRTQIDTPTRTHTNTSSLLLLSSQELPLQSKDCSWRQKQTFFLTAQVNQPSVCGACKHACVRVCPHTCYIQGLEPRCFGLYFHSPAGKLYWMSSNIHLCTQSGVRI